ncbi:MAG: DNA polymerase [Nitrososphaeria archaeon]
MDIIKEWREERKRERNRGYKEKKKEEEVKNRFKNKRFFAIDSEGYEENGKSFLNLIAILYVDDDNENHYYILKEGFNTYRIISWIFQCVHDIRKYMKEGEELEGIIFGSGYDFTMWLKDLTYEDVTRLKKENEVEFEGYKIKMFPKKMLVLSKKYADRRLVISDVFGFTNTSFVRSLQSLQIDISKEELDRIASEKVQRGSFEKEITDEVIEYNKKELEYLLKIAYKIKDTLTEIGWYIDNFYGSGAVGNFLLQSHNIDKISQDNLKISDDVINAYNYAYYGGYIYAFVVGTIKGPIYHYDLKSAYPSIMKELPDLRQGEWIHHDKLSIEEIMNMNNVSVVKCKYKLNSAILPYRLKNGNVAYFRDGQAWYNVAMIKALYPLKKDEKLEIEEAYEFVPEGDTKPFGFVEEIYKMKESTNKKENPVQYSMYKIGMNSLYGKMIQGVGANKFYNIIYASAITGGTRAKLIKTIREIENKHGMVYMVMTDSIFTSLPIENGVGEKLGEWGLEGVHDEMGIVQTGLYYTRDKDTYELKKRGIYIDSKGNNIQEIQNSYKSNENEIIQRIKKYFKNANKEFLVKQKNRFNAITVGSTPKNYQKIGNWTVQDEKSMSIISYLKMKGIYYTEEDLKGLDKKYFVCHVIRQNTYELYPYTYQKEIADERIEEEEEKII